MVNISIDVTDLGGEARPGDKVVLWKPAAAGSATHAGRVISTAPVDVFLTNGKATVPDVEPGSMRVLLQCRGVESQGPVTVGVPDGDHTVTLRALLESQFEYAPPIVSAVQEAASNASASEEAAIQAQIRSEAAADRADAKVDAAINNGANLIRNEVKQDADRAVDSRERSESARDEAEAYSSGAEQAALEAANARDRSISEADLSEDAAAVSVATAIGLGDEFKGRISSLEAMNGVAPETPVDGQTASLIEQPETLTSSAVSSAIDEWSKTDGKNAYAPSVPVNVFPADALGVSSTDPDVGITITEALAALPEGASIYLPGDYTAKTSIIVSKPVRILGPGRITAQHDNPLFDVQSDNVSFDGGLRLVGKPHDSYIAQARGISCQGTLEEPRHNLHVGRVAMESFAGGGIVCRFVKNLTTSEGLEISDARYYGIGLGSCDTVKLVKPVIRNISPISASNSNCYGITATHSDGTPETSPSSANITIEEALIEDVPTWVGIDTHGGRNVTVIRPTVRRCLCGISLVSGPGEDGSEQRAPIDFLVDSPRVEDCSGYGVGVSGAGTGPGVWAELATGAIINPTIVRCGNPDSNNSGAVWLRSTKGVRLSGVRAFEPGSHGVCLSYNNFDFHIEDIVVVDPWSNTHTLPSVIAQRSSYNTGTIESFRGLLGGKTATDVLKFGLHSGTATGTAINLGTACVVDSGILAYEAGTGNRLTFESQASVIKLGRWQSELGFYGATPIPRQTVSAAATDPETTQELVNDLRDKLIALGIVR